eukprot:2592117-Pleurochrysis_carterae.AAC.1
MMRLQPFQPRVRVFLTFRISLSITLHSARAPGKRLIKFISLSFPLTSFAKNAASRLPDASAPSIGKEEIIEFRSQSPVLKVR